MDVADNIELVRTMPEAAASTAVDPQLGAAERGPTDPASAEAQSDTDSRSAPLRSSTVMMVDDDPIMLEVVQTYLEEAGYTSFVTTSEPRQAMDLFLQKRPDILLLDLMMPEVSGFDILARIRAHEELRYTPVIILTAESEPNTKLKALELGATDLLTKPVDPSELRLRLRNALAFKAYQDRLADFDALTGLPNRRKFHQAVDVALKNTQQSRACALLHIDLDRFKQINDTLGHRVGDKLLCAVAQLLDRTLCDAEATGWPGSREPEFKAALSRIGSGNGFAALLPNLHNLKKVDTAGSIARRVLAAFAEPFRIEGHELFVTASIGIAVSPADGQDAETLLKHAEMAMYQAKQRGRKTYEFFSGDMNAHALERLTLENQLRRAVERNEFVLYYQPKVDVSSGCITGAEALVRWKHPELGIVSPAKFIPIAEETGLIVEIGQWVLRAACAQIQAWMQRGLPPLSVSVNVSGVQFKQRKVWHAVRGALAHSALPPGQLMLELTESILMENATDSIEMLNELKEMGLKLAVDDFGTGYSSLAYLKRFPLDELKIDRSFVKGLPQERDDLAIVGAIIALARELNLRVVAEGVETKEQLEFLRSRDCAEYQGYLCSRPAPPEAFAILMRRQSSQRIGLVANA
ncbi:MAG TPA: EAL domain-containing protein [Burkholderiales bacterium]|nr:EAL domain-containing protein [Burkholderiales bacterium]